MVLMSIYSFSGETMGETSTDGVRSQGSRSWQQGTSTTSVSGR
jgi:hypothetical protein